MANTIKVTTSVTLSGTPDGGISMSGSVTVPQQGSNFTKETQIISSTTVTPFDINPNIAEGDLGYFFVANTAQKVAGVLAQDSQFVDIFTDSAGNNKIASVLPSEHIFIRPPGGTVALFGKANNGGDIQVVFGAIET
jgi:hypothetical protein